MPYNGSGTFSTTTSFVADTTISSDDMNTLLNDIASGLTNAMTKDGQSGATGQIKLSSGTVAAPGLAFASETGTGLYRIGGSNVGIALSGTKYVDISTTASNFVAPVQSNGVLCEAFASGTVMLFVQTSAPTGWTKGSTHDNKALRIVTGTAGTGGSTAFTSVFGARTIATGNLPVVTPTVASTSLTAAAQTTTTHTRTGVTLTITGSTKVAVGNGTQDTDLTNDTVQNATSAVTGTITMNSFGSGTAMDFAVQYVDCILATKN